MINSKWIRRIMGNKLSLTNRVMIFVALAISFSLITINFLVRNAVERHFAEQDAEELFVITEAVARQLQLADNADNKVLVVELLSHAVSGHHGVYFQVWGPSGNLIYGPSGAEFVRVINQFKPSAKIEMNSLRRWQAEEDVYRGIMTQTYIGEKQYLIVAAINMDFHIQFLEAFHRNLWLIMIIAGAMTLLATWYGVHQGHAPIRNLSQAMREVQANRLHMRHGAENVPMELRSLVAAFNYMIGRLEESFSRLSHFSADIAHELRTPLTNLITQTQVMLGKSRSLTEYRELLYSNLEEQERLSKMVNDMLWLAKNEHGLLKHEMEPLDFAWEVKELFDFFEALADEKKIRLVLEGGAPTVFADRSLIRRALSNLLSNAIRHTPQGESILVRLDSSIQHQLHISVVNPGLEISAEHLPRIFERFYRIDPSRARQSEGAGLGLGLAIVKSIVEVHGGHIEASSKNGVNTFTFSVGEASQRSDSV